MMSIQNISNYVKKYPLLIRYAQLGLVNLNAVARLIKEKGSTAAVGMELRRYLNKQSKNPYKPFDFSLYKLQIITRSNIHEIFLNKTLENRKNCLKIVNNISKTKYFVTMVEGEKEIVVMTDKPSKGKSLGYISVNFPIELRQVPGIYSVITSSLADANISIHSFHTIGGEILILVKNEDLMKAQEVLQGLLF